MKHFFFMVVLLMTCLLQQAVAQDRSISGRVTDRANGQGLPGVTVLAKGTSIGASTNADGAFTLTVPASVTRITFSFIGYATQERDANAATIDVALASDNRQLDEVVVTGLATSIKRSNLANAITTISAKELVGSTRPVTIDAALSGKVAGANIVQTSGAPGGGTSIQLRGISSITGNGQPLYVIDGVYAISEEVGNGAGAQAFTGASSGTGRTSQDQGTNRISDLNPSDIESIEILKGPSAAAIYGTRANNGVILIKTKRGTAGKSRISLSQDIGYMQAWHLLGMEGWNNTKIDKLLGGDPDEKAKLAAATASGKIYDYEKEIFGNKGFMRNTSVSISGGSDRTKFYVSGTTTKEDGIVKNTGFERSSIRANVDQKVSKLLDVSLNSAYSNSTNRRGFFGNDNNGVAVAYNLFQIPNYAELHANAQGLYPNSAYSGDNPLAIIEKAVNKERTDRVTEAATATLHLLDTETSSLRFASQGGIDFASSTAMLALPGDLQSQISPAPGVLPGGIVRQAKNQFFNYNLQSFLIYDWKIGENINLTSQVGAVRLGISSNLSYQQGQTLAPGPLLPNRGAVITQAVALRDETDIGYVAQQEINFRDQIIATGGIRFDKSSRNGDIKKLYAFPKASLAVNIAKFDFWTVDAVNQIKLRAAYGETGGPAPFGATYSPLSTVATGGRIGIIPATLVGNPAIGPERATEFEAGIDLGFLDNRIGLEASFYNKKVINIISTYTLSPGTGVAAVGSYPIGDLRNRGVEIGLMLNPVRSSSFNWTMNNQFWFNRSEVTRLIVPAFVSSNGFGASYGTNYYLLGESPSRFYGTPRNVTDNPNTPSNLTRYADAQPRFNLTTQNTFTIAKNIELSFLLQWKKDSYNSNLTLAQSDGFGTTSDWSGDSGFKDSKGVALTNGEYRATLPASLYIENSGYVRLREASVYYSLPATLRTSIFKDYVSNLRVGVSGNNIYTWTNYRGYDPEVSNFGQNATGANVDLLSYPGTRRLFFHFNLEF